MTRRQQRTASSVFVKEFAAAVGLIASVGLIVASLAVWCSPLGFFFGLGIALCCLNPIANIGNGCQS